MELNVKQESRIKRRAVSGTLGSLMLFSMIFTVGGGYFLFVINGDSLFNQALHNKTSNLQSQLAESLTIIPASGASNHLVFTATNGGGLAANITDVFVVDPAGVTHSYGVGFGASNTTPALPGGVTPQKTSASYDTGITIVSGTYAMKVITHRGNAFTATYPVAPTNYASSTGSLTVDLSSFKWVQLTGTSSITQESYVPNCNAALCGASFSSSVTTGDTLVYAVGWPNHVPPATPTDTRGDTFTLGASNTVSAPGSSSPPALVQKNYNSNCSAASCGLAYTSNVASGNTLAFALGWYNQNPPSTPTDTRGDTFTLGVSNSVAASGGVGSPSVVQSRYTSNCASSSCGLGFTSNVVSGHTLVYGLGWFGTTPSCGLALDGSASGKAQNSQPVSVTLTTSCSPDVIYVAVAVDAGTIATPTSTGLTFSLRASQTSPNAIGKVATYYAIASTVLSSKVITETASGQSGTTVIAWGISGANTASPFDPNASIPAKAGSTGQVSTVTISTSNAKDFILGANVDNSPGEASTAPSPFALIATGGYPAIPYYEGSADYETVSSTQTNLAVKITGGASVSNWAIIADAITAALVAVDGSATGCFGGTASAPCTAPGSSGTVTLTTTNSNDVIVVDVSNQNNVASIVRTVSSVTATGLTFVKRSSVSEAGPSPYQDTEVWWAIASSPLSSVTITVTLSGVTDAATIIAFGVSGANTATPWDPNASLPKTTTVVGGGLNPSVSGVSTSNANDMIIGVEGDCSGSSGVAGSGFTLIAYKYNGFNVNPSSTTAEHKIVSATQSGITVTVGTSAPLCDSLVIADAIQAAGIAIDNTATSTANADGSGNVAISFTVGTGSNRLLVVAGEVDNRAVTGVTYGGTALTQAVADSIKPMGSIWYLKNPPSGTASVVISSGSSGAGRGATFGVVSFTGVDQTTPIPTTAKNDNANGATSPATVSITNANANAWVMDVVATANIGSITNGAPTTQQWNIHGTLGSGGSSERGPLAANTVTNFSWTLGTADAWNDLAVEINPATTGAPFTPPAVTDTLGDSFTLGVSNSVVSGSTTYYSYIWYGTAGSSAADTITATFSTAVTGSISIYELSGVVTTTPITSTGSSSAGSTNPSVSFFTPNSNSLVIGHAETASSTSSFTAGGGYTLSGTCPSGYGCGEYLAGGSSATTVPFTLGASAPWVESAISFTPTSGNTYYSYIWYATTGSAGADTITAVFSAAVTGSVSIYEISGAVTAGALTSTGSSSGGSTTPSVSSFTPGANSFVIGNTETSSGTSSFTAGGGFTLSGTCSSVYGCGEYQAGLSSTMGVPFTLGVTATWVESAISFSPSNVVYYSYIWYATAGSSGADTISASFSSAVTGSVSIYDMAGYTAAGLLTSYGSSWAGSTNASVTSFTPSANSIVIGNVETASGSTSYTAGVGYNLVDKFNCNPSPGCGEYHFGLGATTTVPIKLSSPISWVESAISFASGSTYQSGVSQGGYPTTGLPNDVSIVFQVTLTNQDPQGRSVTLWPQSSLAVIAVKCSGGGGDHEGSCEGEEGGSNMNPYFIIDGINGGVNGIVAYNSTKNFVTLPPGVKTTLYFGARRPLGGQPNSIQEDLESLFMAFFALTGQYSDTTLYGQTIPYPVGIVTGAAASTSANSGITGAVVTVTGNGFNSNTRAFIGWVDSTGKLTTLKKFTTDGSGNIPASTTFQVPSASDGFYTIMVSDYTNAIFRTFQHTS